MIGQSFRITFAASTVDAAAGVIRGVSVITEGPVRGHSSWNKARAQAVPLYADGTTLAQVKKCAETYEGGLKVKLNHGAGAEGIIGSLKGFAVNGPKLTADLFLLENAEKRAYVMELAQKMPESCGLSIAFTGEDEPGSGDDEDKAFARCTEIYSCDLVDEPAANPDGLFSIHGLPETKPAQGVDATQREKSMDEKQFEAKTAEFQTKLDGYAAQITELSKKLDEKVKELEAKVADRSALAQEIAKQFAAVVGKGPEVKPDAGGDGKPAAENDETKFRAAVVTHYAATKSKAKALSLAMHEFPAGHEAAIKSQTDIKYA